MEAVLSFPRLGFEVVRVPGIKLRHSIIAMILCLVMITTGCTAAWITTALADIAVLIPMAQSIASLVALTQGNDPPSQQEIDAINNIGATAENGLKALQAYYNSYTSANAATTIAKIQAGGAALIINLNQLLAAAQIKNPALLAKVKAAVAIIVNTVNVFMGLLPFTQPSMSRKAAKALAQNLPTPESLKQQWQEKVGVPIVGHK